MSLLDFLKRTPRKRKCARCGLLAAHGYSRAAESDPKEITALCLPCLVKQLDDDYKEYRGRAVVVEPTPRLPCFVFRDREYLLSVSADLAREVDTLLHRVGGCVKCPGTGCCLWISCRGLNIDTFPEMLEKGLTRTLLTSGNPAPESMCGKCTADRIGRTLESGDFEYFEICSPHDGEQGIVMPMGY